MYSQNLLKNLGNSTLPITKVSLFFSVVLPHSLLIFKIELKGQEHLVDMEIGGGEQGAPCPSFFNKVPCLPSSLKLIFVQPNISLLVNKIIHLDLKSTLF